MLEQQKADLEKARDRELYQLRDKVAAESPDVLEQAVAELLAEDRGFLFLYNRDKSALENYQSRHLYRHCSTLPRSMIPPALKP